MEKRMFPGDTVLAIGWMGIAREAREAGLMAGIWVPYTLP